MFKIPEWEGDIPKTNVNFLSSHKTNKRNQAKDNSINKEDKPKNTSPSMISGKKKKLKNKQSNNNKQTNFVNINKSNTAQKKKPNVQNLKTIHIKKEICTSKQQLSTGRILEKNKKKKLLAKEKKGQSYDNDKPDEMLINAGKKKFNDVVQQDDSEELLFSNQQLTSVSNGNLHTIRNGNTDSQNTVISKADKKKLLIKSILKKENFRRHIDVTDNGNKLRERMLERLKAAQFRYLNEKLYTTSGTEAQKLFQSDPVAFQTYHQGYQQQVKKWPIRPLDVIVKKITKMPKSHLVVDMGCGEAELSKRVSQKVRSFDLVAASTDVEACDMAHTPLLSASVDVAVYCLALMGTDLTQYLVEANRVLKVGGFLLIAEVESRFDDVESFAKEVQRLGFKLKELDKSNQVFFFMEFVKTQEPPVKKSKLPQLTLKPCLYKKR